MRLEREEVKKEEIKKTSRAKVKRPLIHNVHILDVSFSMNGEKYRSALDSIKKEVELLSKESNADYTETYMEFSGPEHMNLIRYKVPMKEVNISSKGCITNTAMNDAIGFTLRRLLEDKMSDNEKVLVKIFTDGEENASQKETYETIKTLIKECEDKGFTITFIGTHKDVSTVVKRMSIPLSNTLSHDNTSKDIIRTMSMSFMATTNYTDNVLQGKDVKENFYTKTVVEEKKKEKV